MKNVLRASLVFSLLFTCSPVFAQWLLPGDADFAKAVTKVLPVRGNIILIQIRTPQSTFNAVVLAGPDGYLLVDHPEPAANPAIQKVLDGLGKRPVKFLLNTHWHYDHVGGNAIYGPDAVIVAHEKVRERLKTKQTPYRGADVEGTVRSLSVVLDRSNDDTVIITGRTEMSNRRDLAQYVQLLNETISLVRQEIAAGKSEKDTVDAGLPELWKPWFTPETVPREPQFMQEIYATLAHTNDLNQ